MLSPKQILQKYWGFSTFRESQEVIIKTILQKKDVIAILPTGSGKSIIYQVAGLSIGGITVVISPLIALIEEQNNKLNQLGIKSIALTGYLPFYELERLLDNVQFGQTKFVFLSPERLKNDFIKKRLANMPVNLLVIDEAHCISEWGHDFRPSYTKIHKIKELLPDITTLALTATAKNLVINDIKTYLKLKKPVVFKSSVIRQNIAYKVFIKPDKLNCLKHYLKPTETAIVYVKTRKKTYQYAGYLAKHGFKTAFFHGGMNLEEKQKSLNDWLQNKSKVMFATTAFGMGIDKPDVRRVYHLDLPASLENYVQESGRAGRDGKMSEAGIILEPNDWENFEANFLKMIPSIAFIEKVYSNLYNHFYIAENDGDGKEFDLDFLKFCYKFKLKPNETLQAFQIMESEEILKTKQSKQYQDSAKILITAYETRKYIENQRLGWKIINYFIRSFIDIFQLNTPISLDKISQKLDLPKAAVIEQLNILQQREIINYKPRGEYFKIFFIEPRNKNLFLYHKKRIEKRLLLKQQQVEKVYDYVKNTEICRSVYLAKYFGEKDVQNCGICDVCLSKNDKLNDQEILQKVLNLLQNTCLKRIELEQHFNIPIDIYLDKLIEDGKIILNKSLKYCLK